MSDKRLFRSESDKKIAGVCGGLAVYFNIDVTIIRLLWALVCLAAGTGILAYIVAALIIPTEAEIYG